MPNPAVRLLVWGGTAVAAQLLHGSLLYLLSALAVALALSFSRARLLRLLRRTRWLLLAIALLFSFATPGLLLLPEWGAVSPTVDGLILAGTHLARLITVVASLSLLLEYTPSDQFVGALYGLMAPASCVGVDRGRIAVRLMLVMHYVESARGGGWREWLEPSAPNGPECIVLTRTPWRWHDIVAVGVALLAVAGLLAA